MSITDQKVLDDLERQIAEDTGAAERQPDVVHNPMAEWVVEHHMKGKFAWTGGLGWLEYNDGVWEKVEYEAVQEFVASTFSKHVKDEVEAGAAGNPTRMRELAKLGNQAFIKATVSLASGKLRMKADEFDPPAFKHLLNCPNGVVDLRNGQLLSHDPKYYFTKMAGADYVPGTGTYDWDHALGAIPEDVQNWLQVCLGQAATGKIPDDQIVILNGGGINGKSTILLAVMAALGTFAGQVTQRSIFGAKSDHPTEMMVFRGLRFALLEETQDRLALDTKRLKDSTGNAITSREMRKDNVTFEATHSLFLSSNFLPIVKETDEGTWRRLRLVSFPYRYRLDGEAIERSTDRRAIPGLRDRLRDTPSEAVLSWLVAGAVKYYNQYGGHMPSPPARVAQTTAAWRAENDPLMAFFKDRIEFSPGWRVTLTDLYDCFTDWATETSAAHSLDAAKFKAKFWEHGEVKGNEVKRGRTGTTADGLSYLGDEPPLDGRPRCAVGVRFK